MLRLDAGTVHLWWLALHDLQAAATGFSLGSKERARCNRFRFERDRVRYALVWGALRQLLSAYTRTAAQEIEFELGPYGKPRLAREASGGVQFNLSHSRDRVLFAFGRGASVGVDIEYKDPGWKVQELVEQCFSSAERSAFERRPQAEQHDVFYDVWTRKEAVMKCTGEGLFRALDSFDVTVDPAATVCVHRLEGVSDARARFELRAVRVESSYAAAVCRTGSIDGLEIFRQMPAGGERRRGR